MLVKSYKELKFWQTSRRVSLQIIKLSRKLPNERMAWIIADQVLRSSFSVGANIAEGFGKFKGKEYRRYLKMALGSANETEYWLELLIDAFPMYKDEVKEIVDLNLQTVKMLSSAVKSLQQK